MPLVIIILINITTSTFSETFTNVFKTDHSEMNIGYLILESITFWLFWEDLLQGKIRGKRKNGSAYILKKLKNYPKIIQNTK